MLFSLTVTFIYVRVMKILQLVGRFRSATCLLWLSFLLQMYVEQAFIHLSRFLEMVDDMQTKNVLTVIFPLYFMLH